MSQGMFQRTLTPLLKITAKSFPVTVLTGPRQSGKTTLLKSLFPNHRYVTLEAPDTLLAVQINPRGFLNSLDGPCIIDEAQNAPALFSYIQGVVDEKHQPGQFILSGSQNFLLVEKISQTLAGRAAILELLPLSLSEYKTHPKATPKTVWEWLFYGSYPRPYQENLDFFLWYQSYLKTYLERDVRNLINIQDLGQFQLFLKLCAGRHGQLLNLTSLGQDCSLSQTTARKWLSVLEASHLVFRLQPYYKNFNKRLVKTPKLYFYDPGMVCRLLGIESPQHLQVHSSRGAIFEGYVVGEIAKYFIHQGKPPPIYFWRDHSDREVDLLVEQGETLHPIEIKSGETFRADFTSGLRTWQKWAERPKHGILVYAGNQFFDLGDIKAQPWDFEFDKI